MEKLLVADDDESIRESLQLFLSSMGYFVKTARDGKEAVKMLESEQFDLIITDLFMPKLDGYGVLKRARELDSAADVIIITGYDEIESIISAIQAGAADFIEKPLVLKKLNLTIRKTLERKRLTERLADSITDGINTFTSGSSLIGKAPAMREIYKKIGMIAGSRVTVLISGESGTGKELISKVIHYSGITKQHPFTGINCSALNENLLESELFGHVKGAFTGAVRDKKGKFELAEEGTIFLDEVSEIPASFQVKLLRVIQEKEFERVGGEVTLPVKARIIASTNRDLKKMVDEGSFREDLYYRLKVFSIEVPPLRERAEDIPLLVVHLLRKINQEVHRKVTRVPDEVMEMLKNYEWAGNVRELENTLMRAVVLSKSDLLEKENLLLQRIVPESASGIEFASGSRLPLSEIEKHYIRHILQEVKWNKTKACQVLGISKPTLYSKMITYNITRE